MINFRVDNKLALVTGSSRGIGMSIAIALAEAGADIIGVSSKPEAGSPVEKAVNAAGKKFYSYQADLSDRKSLYSFIEKVKADHAKIDILINNAGHILRKPVAEHPDEYWDTIMQINLDSQFILTREIGKRMIEDGYGKIVLKLEEIVYCEAERSYTVFHLTNGKTVTVSKPLLDYDHLLRDTSFLRIHKSFLINLHHVKEYQRGEGGMVIMSNNAEIEVSRRKKEVFLMKVKEVFRS